jgi:hypothetical protein
MGECGPQARLAELSDVGHARKFLSADPIGVVRVFLRPP